MNKQMMRWLALAGILLGCTTILVGAKHASRKAYLNVRSAGPDFQIQGEYEGTVRGKNSMGVQVIALGENKFRAVAYVGGLPGAGWNGSARIALSGETKEGVTRFGDGKSHAEIKARVFTGVIQNGDDMLEVTAKKVVRKSPTLGAKPPKGAVVLFDGTNTDAWQTGKIEEGNLLGVPARSKHVFKNFRLHLEFRTPFMPQARGQGRGNSGVYLLDQYECQVLDSFGLTGENNECGGIYKIAKPCVNMCLPPLSWQTYDIDFHAARFDNSGHKVANAVVTIRHNGVVIHDKLELPHATPGGGRNDEKPGPLFLQNHHNPVRYRNIWIVDIE